MTGKHEYEKEQRNLRNSAWWIEMELLQRAIETALMKSKLDPIDQLLCLHEAMLPLLRNEAGFPLLKDKE